MQPLLQLKQGENKMKNRKYNRQVIITAYKNGMSYPELERKFGICRSYALQIMHNAGVSRSISEAVMLKRSGKTKWRKLVQLPSKSGKKHPTRVTSIPWEILKHLGFEPNTHLVGKWEIQGKDLLLKVRADQK